MNDEKIETVEELIKVLQSFDPSTKIIANYNDIYGNDHYRSIYVNNFQYKNNTICLNLNY